MLRGLPEAAERGLMDWLAGTEEEGVGGWEGTSLRLSLRSCLRKEGWTEPAGALESWTEPAGALESWAEPAGVLESWAEPAGALESMGRWAGASGKGAARNPPHSNHPKVQSPVAAHPQWWKCGRGYPPFPRSPP